MKVFTSAPLGLKLSDTFELRLSTFVVDSVYNNSQSCFYNFFLFSSSAHQYCTKQACQDDLHLSRQKVANFQCGLKSVRCHGANLWNMKIRKAPKYCL